ncbi:MAG TPA: rhomboid family intramembrane serine protease [Candidatus Solibacter sp.]|nr:rhomboid family intramembrane serine protease [Candidatus Solibacter sp.]
MILIPLRHENMRGRRWPVVTFALIALNIVAFLATHWTIDEQTPERTEVRTHLLFLAAMHPELKMGDEAHKFIDPLAAKYPELWKQLASPSRKPVDAWDANIRQIDEPDTLQTEMDNLSLKFEDVERSSILGHYAYVPAHPSAVSYLTANFLHAGWLHLIGNMWFLWLAGFILEDNWGRAIYATFYLLAGAIALQFHGWMYSDSFVPLLGASGAVAALMGAFLVRFPKLKIEMLWFAFFFRVRFKAAAYWLLPLWGAMELFYGSLFGQASGVAHWAHVGGFVFGMVGALVLSRSGLEHKVSSKIEEQVSWTAEPAIVQATEAMEQGNPEEAIKKLRAHIAAKPDSADALVLLQQVCWRKGDSAGHQNATVKLCQLHLKHQDGEAAWSDYEEFLNTGGQNLPASIWLELCRWLEGQQNFDRAVTEYDKLAIAYPKEKQSLLALMAAGRLSLKKLSRPAEALHFYRAASASTVPHLDWESNIQGGIKEATAAIAVSAVSAE